MVVKIEYMPNQKLGELIFLKETEPYIQPSGQKKRMGLFKCKCGKSFYAIIDNVKSKKTRSCECEKIKQLTERSITHGLSNSILYGVWSNIKTRCYNSKTWNYNHYGGRGIIMCDEWKNDFRKFYNWAIPNGWEKGLQIDRIDNDGNYEPSNCRFVTVKENARNRSTTKLTEQDVRDIRIYKDFVPNCTNLEIAEYYGITPTLVCQILNNKVWAEG